MKEPTLDLNANTPPGKPSLRLNHPPRELTPFLKTMQLDYTFTAEGVILPLTPQQIPGLRKLVVAYKPTITDEALHQLKKLAEQYDKPFPFDGTLIGLRDVPLSALNTVSARREEKFRAVGITNVYTLLTYIPLRYIDRTHPTFVNQLRENVETGIVGTVHSVNVDTRRGPRKAIVRIGVKDQTGIITATYFNAVWQAKKFTVGEAVIMYGKPEKYLGRWSMVNPILDPHEQSTTRIIPVYPQSGKNDVSTWEIRRAVHETLQRLMAPHPPLIDPIPPEYLTPMGLPGRWEAFTNIHFPSHIDDVERARERIAFDELLRMQTVLLMTKHAEEQEKGYQHLTDKVLPTKLLTSLPFPLTAAQRTALQEIHHDLRAPHPMHRLLQGDVGSGKAQPLTSHVLTPRGYRTMGSLHVGDELANPQGNETSHVTGIYPQGLRDVYTITFTDGSHVEADGEHLWKVVSQKTGEEHLLTTTRIQATLTDHQWRIRNTQPVHFTQLHPTASNSSPTSDWTFIPDVHKHASVSARTQLLETFFGNDTSYKTPHKQLAEDLVWVIRSLGGNSTLTPSSADEKVYTVTSELPDEEATLYRRISHITLEETKTPMQCITVSHPNRLYITDNFTPTHNTLVAVTSLLTAVEAGYQAALMAPTEILARQLYTETVERTEGLTVNGHPIRVEYVTNALRGKKRTATLERLAEGEVDVVVGTHALLVHDIRFAKLGLIVVDEQHRFGVEQRAVLREHHTTPEGTPDMLIMTATPIPRTTAMTVFGDLDVTVLNELPPGRTPIKTSWINADPELYSDIAEPWPTVREHVQKGQQVFVVCPLVTESEKLQATSAEETFHALQTGALHDMNIGLVHGQQKAEERDRVMNSFRDGNIDVIVATTVIEVGVNVPNATLMVVLDAPRFGISQLHQLRGRVGRGKKASECVLVGYAKTPDGKARMQALVDHTDGFKLAEIDAELRSMGQIFGKAQSGQSDLLVADLQEDVLLLENARTTATSMLASTPDLSLHPHFRDEIDAILTPELKEWLYRN